MLGKIRAYLSERIIRLLFFLIIVLIFVAVTIWIVQFYINEHYEKPALKSIANQNSKDKLSRIVIRDVLLIDSQYRTMLSSYNIKHIDNLFKTVMELIEHCQLVLHTIKNGGMFKDVQLVNFYNKDQISENIKYDVPENETVQVDVINIGPRLAELKELVKNSVSLLKQKILSEQKREPDTFNLVLLTKQTDALLLRTREDANKIHYDIKQENNASQKLILKSKSLISLIIIAVNIIAAFFVLGFAIMIAIRIYEILMSQKSAEEKVLKTNNSMNTIIENIPVGVILINKNKEIIHINKQSAELLKYDSISDAKIMIGKKCDSYFCQAKIGKCPIFDFNKEKILFREEIMSTKEGHEDITVLKSAIPITLNNEDLIMEVFVDISERKQYQYELEQNKVKLEEIVKKRTNQLQGANLELEQTLLDLKQSQSQVIMNEKLVGVGQLAAGIAHEINTPVQYIGSNLGFLMDAFNDIIPILNKTDKLESISDQKEIEKTLNEIKDEMKIADIDFLKTEIPESLKQSNEGVRQISKIVRAMKHFVHPGQKDKQYHDINTIIKNTIDISRNEWKYFADLTVKSGKNLPKVFCLGYEIGQVFLNLIVNAAYTIKKKIGEEGEKKGKITIYIANKKEFLEIRISDTGTGIPEENQSRIFEPFFTTKPVGSGTGQGLSMAYTIIVNEHNGDIDFETDLGKGTTFIIKLPLDKEDVEKE